MCLDPGVLAAAADTDGDGLADKHDTNTEDDGKDGGWQRFTNPSFRNQGQCVSHHQRRR